MNVPPWLIFLMLIASTLALGYQLASRRYGWRVIGYGLFIFVGLAGFEALAESAGVSLTRFGDVRLLPDLVGGAVTLSILWFLGI